MAKEINFDLVELYEMEERNGRKYDYVRLTFADLNGVGRTNVVPRRHLEKNLKDGFALFSGRLTSDTFGNSLHPKEIVETEGGNCLIIPCRKTLHNCSWLNLKNTNKTESEVKWMVGEVLCEIKWPLHYRGGAFNEACPRYVLRKQLDKFKELDLLLLSAFEIEYILLHKDTMKPVFDDKSAGSVQTLAEFENYLYNIESNCSKSGLDIEAIRVEHGEGQFEFVMSPQYGENTSDGVFCIKEAIKEISSSMGYVASFMSLPYENVSTNGFHLNLSLWNHSSNGDHTNAFYGPEDPDKLSSLFRHFLAGLIKHSKALTAFNCPTVNCYRRLHTFLVPHKINWGFDNRRASYRVKQGGASSTYLENRIPSSACNPYLVTAATLVAGLDGIRNQLTLPEKCTEKRNSEDFKEIRVEEADKDNYLPYTLEESLEALEENQVMVEGLGENLVRWFVMMKRDLEVKKINSMPMEERLSKERELYFKHI